MIGWHEAALTLSAAFYAAARGYVQPVDVDDDMFRAAAFTSSRRRHEQAV